jgi:cysteinyl-tRNA synthetase
MIFTVDGVGFPMLARARVYVCGITPYDTTHIGHAATFVWVDTLARVLEHVGIEVQLTRNVTDIDDDLLNAARTRNVSWHALATQQTYRFEDDMRKLRVRRPTFEPLAREYVTDVIFLARALLDRGAAYERNGTVWFKGAAAVAAAGVDADEAARLVVAHGGEPAERDCDDPLDVAVWRRSAEGEPAWASPWGEGRPGWHAECAAMATSVLGMGIDVQAGGADLAFPHHVYSTAMVEAATGVTPFARAHMHVGTVMWNGEKVAKSTGNLVFVEDLLRRWSGEAIRLHLLDRPWEQSWEFDESELAATASRLEAMWSAAGAGGAEDEAATAEALAALADGLDVPRALTIAEAAGGGTVRTIGKLLGVL